MYNKGLVAHKELNVSLYYSDVDWHIALSKGVRCFLKELKGAYHDYLIELSRERGDHIKLTFFVHSNSAFSFSQEIDAWFKQFLKKHPSRYSEKHDERIKIFADFDNDSVHYGTFNIRPYPSISCFVFRCGISRLILKLFQHYKEDTLNSLFEIVIQLIIIFCNTVYYNIDDIYHLINTLLQEEYDQLNDLESVNKVISEGDTNFENNKSELISLVENHLRPGNLKYNDQLESFWCNLVAECDKSLKDENVSDLIFTHSLMLNELFDSLGFKYKITVLLLLKKSIKKSNLYKL
ncbi:hypothetical protein OOZ15_00905 [Galbibacter sp. EGI 63066]|uniref:hypothetical protein n=1 Tax=Galbibacter sp. EGI 63066 TaxID=2993559 RepID=UPI00224941CA|nr:hypothetical protein [Galbibacter sp. EGI 63066]MCX2678488.1 hypothetical protein [Galbibacter sp. EGI 63066]